MKATVPTRHPSEPQPIPGLIRLAAIMFGVKDPTDLQWQEIGESLMVGDAPMDDLVAWMHSVGMANARPYFEQALREGIANVPNAPEPLRDFFIDVEAVPDWVDPDLIRQGQRAMRMAGADGLYIARDVALVGGYMFSGFNKTLLRTGALKKGSNKRFAETTQWALDVMSEGGLEPGGVGYQSTIRVRMIHAFVRRYVSSMPDWNSDEWGLPVNQTDMAATLLGALIAPGVGAPLMGLLGSSGDAKAAAHVTRYVGWLIGVQEEWLPHSYRHAVTLLVHTLQALSAPDESTKLLAAPMADDPLIWRYPNAQWLRRRIARAQHLSVTTAFLGPRAMRTLGLPAYVPPWYPVLRFPVNITRSIAAMTLPGGMDRAAARGWREMQEVMNTMVGGDVKIGASTVARAA